MERKRRLRLILITFSAVLGLLIAIVVIVIFRTFGRTLIQFDIHQNKEVINLSTFGEPPQFAIWIENDKTHRLKTVFVTNRVSTGDWEGKANVPVALPRWFELFRGINQFYKIIDNDKYMAVTGATPKDDYFSIRIEVKPGSKWICWLEVNLAGDFNVLFPEFNKQTLTEDEFSCGQPALLYNATIVAEESMKFTPILVAQSIWADGKNWVEPVSNGVTTAKNIFDIMQISVIRPKPKLIDVKNKYLFINSNLKWGKY